MGKHLYAWHDQQAVLNLFARQRKTAVKRYRQFIQEGMNYQETKDLSGGGLVRSYGGWDSIKFLRKEHEVRIGDERILGDSDFVESVLKNDTLNMSKRTDRKEKGWDLDKLILTVCDYFDVEQTALQRKGRQNTVSLAKSLICYWGTQEIGLSSTVIASFLNISQPAVSKGIKRGEEYCLLHKLEFNDFLVCEC